MTFGAQSKMTLPPLFLRKRMIGVPRLKGHKCHIHAKEDPDSVKQINIHRL